MNCLKCGKKTGKTEAFCQECMEVMERYPVPSGTPLVIHRRAAIQKKTVAKKKLSPEELVVKQRRLIKQMALVLALFTLILGVGVFWLVREILEPGVRPEETKGQNYSTQPTITTTVPIITTTTPDSTAEDTTPPDTTIEDTTPNGN